MGGLTGSPALWLVLALALYGSVILVGQGVRIARGYLRPVLPVPQSILVLTRNQEHQVEPFLRALLNLLRQSPRAPGPADVVVVDQASSDATPYILDRFAREQHIRLLRLPPEQVAAGYEMAHFLCHGRIATVIDLRGDIDAKAVLHTLSMVW